MIRRALFVCLVTLLAFAGTAFAQTKPADGVYFAAQDSYDAQTGWKEQVVVTVSGGKITKVNWNGVSNLGVPDKKIYSVAGGYGMEKASALKLRWDQEAGNVEAYLIKNQDIGFNKFKQDGTTDAISGASIHVSSFYTLVNQALSSPAVAKGIYKKDGWYFGQQSDFDAQTGWKDNILITVVNGTIVDVIWNGVSKDTTKKSKLVESLAGRYGMEKSAKLGAWHVQAAAVQAAIIKAQDPTKIAVRADGTSDAISGASIHVTAVGLAIDALKAAR